MDHHEAGEGGRSDRLPRQILICVCGVGFFIGALLPGCALLAALRWYVLKNGLQSSDRRNIFKTHRKRFKQLLELSGGVLAFSGANFCFAQEKVEQELANRRAELLLGAVPA